MRTPKYLSLITGIVIAFAAGMLAGLTLTNPGLSLMEAVGSIGRVDKYRNIKITEKDIELRNELVSDASMREAYTQYLAFEYAANISLGENLREAIDIARETQGFSAANSALVDRMENYAEFLDHARLRILEAIGTLGDLEQHNRVAVRAVLNDAGNALAQTVFRSSVVYDFLDETGRFLDAQAPDSAPLLAAIHDRLFANMLTNCIINDNRPMLKHLAGKELRTDQDLATGFTAESALDVLYIVDAHKLKADGRFSEESLQSFRVFFNTESLAFGINNMHQLSVALLSQSDILGAFGLLSDESLRSQIGLQNAESMLQVVNSSEQFQGIIGF